MLLIERFVKFLLAESLVDDLKVRYPTLSDSIDALAAEDPSGRQKYLVWQLKQHRMNEPTAEIIDLTQEFHRNIQRLQKKDINAYKTLGELRAAIEKLDKSQRQQKLNVKAETVYRDDKFIVKRPVSPDEAIKYGTGTRWCIAASKSKNYFGSYSRSNNFFYIIIDCTAGRDDSMARVAFTFRKDPETGMLQSLQVFNALDKTIPLQKFKDHAEESYGQIRDAIKNHVKSLESQTLDYKLSNSPKEKFLRKHLLTHTETVYENRWAPIALRIQAWKIMSDRGEKPIFSSEFILKAEVKDIKSLLADPKYATQVTAVIRQVAKHKRRFVEKNFGEEFLFKVHFSDSDTLATIDQMGELLQPAVGTDPDSILPTFEKIAKMKKGPIWDYLVRINEPSDLRLGIFHNTAWTNQPEEYKTARLIKTLSNHFLMYLLLTAPKEFLTLDISNNNDWFKELSYYSDVYGINVWAKNFDQSAIERAIKLLIGKEKGRLKENFVGGLLAAFLPNIPDKILRTFIVKNSKSLNKKGYYTSSNINIQIANAAKSDTLRKMALKDFKSVHARELAQNKVVKIAQNFIPTAATIHDLTYQELDKLLIDNPAFFWEVCARTNNRHASDKGLSQLLDEMQKGGSIPEGLTEALQTKMLENGVRVGASDIADFVGRQGYRDRGMKKFDEFFFWGKKLPNDIIRMIASGRLADHRQAIAASYGMPHVYRYPQDIIDTLLNDPLPRTVNIMRRSLEKRGAIKQKRKGPTKKRFTRPSHFTSPEKDVEEFR